MAKIDRLRKASDAEILVELLRGVDPAYDWAEYVLERSTRILHRFLSRNGMVAVLRHGLEASTPGPHDDDDDHPLDRCVSTLWVDGTQRCYRCGRVCA